MSQDSVKAELLHVCFSSVAKFEVAMVSVMAGGGLCSAVGLSDPSCDCRGWRTSSSIILYQQLDSGKKIMLVDPHCSDCHPATEAVVSVFEHVRTGVEVIKLP